MERTELETQAKELEVEFTEETSDDDLQKAIKEKSDKKEEKKPDKKEKDPEYLENELKKAIDKRDEVKKERRALQDKLKNLEEQIKDSVNPEEIKSLKDELKELREFKSTWEKQKEEEELKQKSDLEKAEIRYKKELEAKERQFGSQFEKLSEDIKKIQEEVNKKDTYINNLRVRTLKGEILEACRSGENKAINPAQIVKILKDDFEYTEDLDKFVHYVKDSKGKITDELDVKEYVHAFLGDTDNENLVESGVNTSSMHTKPTDTNKKTTPTPKFGLDDRINAEKDAMNMGLDMDAYKEVQEMMKAKKAKIEENRKNISNK